MKKKFLALILSVALICSMAGVGTMAWFTSQSKSENNTFSTGTLTLGGVINGEDDKEHFASVSFEDMEPGEPPQKIQETVLKNVGSLPFYLYRITASSLEDDPNTDQNDTILDNVLNVKITIDQEVVYEGKLSQLVSQNGGYFDPIYDIQPSDEKTMVIEAFMDENANNQYQGLKTKCDLTVYASQNDSPITGEPTGREVDMGSTSLFSVTGYNNEDYVNFDWDWDPDDSVREEYILKIKHETGDATTVTYEARIWWKNSEWVYSLDGLNESDIELLKGPDIIRIKKSAFPSTWEGFEVELTGRQSFFEEYETINYNYWSLDRD
ncbi:MAG: hypothetical protein FH751_03835 [Firmicutes bacterium]|nr:hypothetical protein [Bacillota bacterium]